MNIDVFAYSDKGSKTVNEDNYATRIGETRCLAVVCDGLGGQGHGEIASGAAVKKIVGDLWALERPEHAAIYRILRDANELLIQQQAETPEWTGMRTTVVGCVLEAGKLHYFNTGDSRFYFFRSGSMVSMTKDHSVPEMLRGYGEITFNEIRFHPDRAKLIKCLGAPTTGKLGDIYEPLPVQPGDAFLLCSDGFWEYVLEEEMEIDLSKAADSEAWVKSMLVRLYTRMTGNNDNYTVVGGIIE